MLANYTRILPYFIVAWIAKRRSEHFDVVDGYITTELYKGELLSWRKDSKPKA